MRSDLHQRAKKSLDSSGDLSLPLWERLYKSLEAYAGTRLDLLDKDSKARLERNLPQVNAILAKYDIEHFEDYEKMSTDDLIESLRIVRQFGESILEDMRSG